jgi:hypothetical protein
MKDTTAQRQRFIEIIPLLAERLGLKVVKENDGQTCYKLIHDDDSEYESGYWLTHYWQNQETMEVTVLWPHSQHDNCVFRPSDYGENKRKTPNSINIGLNKSISRIAQDIERRLEPFYLPEMLDCVQRCAGYDMRLTQKKDMVNKICAENDFYTNDGSSIYGRVGDRSVKIDVRDHDSMSVKFDYLDHEEIQDLIERLYDFQSAKIEVAA